MMKKSSFVLSGLLVAAVSFGQTGESFDFHVADFRLLTSKQIQAEVGITVAERATLNKFADAHKAAIQDYEKALVKQGKDPSKLTMDDPMLQGLQMKLPDPVQKHLTLAQLKRLRELSLHAVAMGGVLDVIVSKRIGMSADQLKKARTIYGGAVQRSQKITIDVRNQVLAPYRGVKPKTQIEAQNLNHRITGEYQAAMEKRSPEMKAIEAQTKKAIQAVLTSKQLAAYKELQGKPFKPK